MRDQNGRFLPGSSGNPEGRPQGTVSRLGQELQEAAVEILPLWIAAARNGDEEKQKFLLERGLPKFKAQFPNQEVELEGESDAERIRHLFVKTADGRISPSVASEMTIMLSSAARVEEFERLKAEVETLKTILKNRRESRKR